MTDKLHNSDVKMCSPRFCNQHQFLTKKPLLLAKGSSAGVIRYRQCHARLEQLVLGLALVLGSDAHCNLCNRQHDCSPSTFRTSAHDLPMLSGLCLLRLGRYPHSSQAFCGSKAALRQAITHRYHRMHGAASSDPIVVDQKKQLRVRVKEGLRELSEDAQQAESASDAISAAGQAAVWQHKLLLDAGIAIAERVLASEYFRQSQSTGVYLHCARLREVDTSLLVSAALHKGARMPPCSRLHASHSATLRISGLQSTRPRQADGAIDATLGAQRGPSATCPGCWTGQPTCSCCTWVGEARPLAVLPQALFHMHASRSCASAPCMTVHCDL